MSINWFLAPIRADASGVRLYCLPYAGGSAAVYRPWAGLLGPEIEVHAVQLAGRGWRLREKPSTDLDALADDVAAAIDLAGPEPFAVFGHSMGAWLGLEVVRRLEAAGRRPLCFFASGRQAPVLGCTQPHMAQLTDEDFVTEVQSRYGGIPAEILQERELLQLLLPALRADIQMLEGYRRREGEPVGTPIHALVGASDRVVSGEELAHWDQETVGGFDVTALPGGHFYFQPDPTVLLDVIRQRLGVQAAVASCASGMR